MMVLVNEPIDGLDVKCPVEDGVEKVIDNENAGYR